MADYIFVIPLTPEKYLYSTRNELQKVCFQSLLRQKSKNWKAICIGKSANIPDDPRFIQVALEGPKREKLAIALQFLEEQNLEYDYLIRLDDDDIFNPALLQNIQSKNFDVLVDKTHHFYNPFEKEVAKKTKFWFPNTYVLQKELALQKIDSDIPDTIKGLTLIEQDHNLHHHFLRNANIQFSNSDCPVYLRSITKDSITANNTNDISNYLNSFGNWTEMNLEPFDWLSQIEGKLPIDQTQLVKIRNWVNEKRYQRIYEKMVLS